MQTLSPLEQHDIHTLLHYACNALPGDLQQRRLEAELLLADTLNKNRSFLNAWTEHLATSEQAAKYCDLIQRRSTGEPIAYILGYKEFWSLRFTVNPSTLIPRPETEHLVELALATLSRTTPQHIADLGTGSGCIAVSIAHDRPLCNIIATDMNAQTLATAQHNAHAHHCQNIQFRLGDWCAALQDEKFDLIVSNPPYIAQQDKHLLTPDITHEPTPALTAGATGLEAIRDICAQTPAHLRPNAMLMIEHGFDQADSVLQLFQQSGFVELRTHSDYAGHPRITTGKWPAR